MHRIDISAHLVKLMLIKRKAIILSETDSSITVKIDNKEMTLPFNYNLICDALGIEDLPVKLGRPIEIKNRRRLQSYLEKSDYEFLKKIGEGNATAGIRRAILHYRQTKLSGS